MQPNALLRPGEKLDRYVVKKPLGRGRAMRIYAGIHAALRYPVIIKLLTEETETEQVREVAVLRGLRGEAAPEILHVGHLPPRLGGHPYLVMEFLSGEPLCRVLQTHRRLDAERVVAHGTQLLRALQRLHDLGYAHCDIKPDNLMVTQDSGGQLRVSLLDFGAVQPLHEALDWSCGVYGTPPYVAPELMQDGTPNAASDVYSVAAVLYECASGLRCPRSDSGQLPAPLHSVVPVDQALSGVIAQGLQVSPEARFESASAFADALEALQLEDVVEVGLDGTVAGTAQETLDTLRLREASANPEQPLRSVPWYGDSAELLSTHRPMIWALGGDPGMDQPSLAQALELLGAEFDVEFVSPQQCATKRVEFMSGSSPPSVLIFGDLHVLLSEPLLAEVGRQGETSCLLISTHENVELLHNTVNSCSLHGQLCLPAAPEAIRASIARLAERASSLRRRYDGLRLALRDAQDDLRTLQSKLAAHHV